MNKKTYQPKESDVKRGWHFVDAKDQVLGRLSTQIATYLMGKHKTTYSTHMDSGDYVVIVNAKDIKLTGNKVTQKLYYSHSGFPKGFKTKTIAQVLEKTPDRVITKAVYNMLPGNRLRQNRMKRMKIFADENHPYAEKFVVNEK